MSVVHATCVSVGGKGVLIFGCSGSGKSSLALQMMASGADLVSDDRTEIWRDNSVLMARCPDAIKGLIEARGVGLLNADCIDRTQIALVIDLDHLQTERMPEPNYREINGISLRCLHKVEAHYFPAAILQYLRAGQQENR